MKFTSAISNLVENAIKYNVDDGWVRVSIDADHKDFYVTVADSGMGIPEDSLDRIFERFYRVDKSHSREIGGTQQRRGRNDIFRSRAPVIYSVGGAG